MEQQFARIPQRPGTSPLDQAWERACFLLELDGLERPVRLPQARGTGRLV